MFSEVVFVAKLRSEMVGEGCFFGGVIGGYCISMLKRRSLLHKWELRVSDESAGWVSDCLLGCLKEEEKFKLSCDFLKFTLSVNTPRSNSRLLSL